MLALPGPKVKVFDDWIVEELITIKANLPPSKKGNGRAGIQSGAEWDAILIELIQSSSTF